MKNLKFKMKNLIFGLSLIAVALWMAPVAEAATVRNYKTGQNSTNNVSRTDTRTYSNPVNNKIGGALNIDLVFADTGNNHTNGNTVGPNEVDSGNTTASVYSNDLVNLSLLDVDQSDAPETDVVENNTTGQDSTNDAKITRTRSVSHSSNSVGGVLNVSLVILSTGDNSSNGNTVGPNTVDTGNATVGVSHTSDVNSSEVTVTQ